MANKNRYANEIYLMIWDNHMTGEQIFKKLKKTYPMVWLGTVYRNLHLLVQEQKLMKTTWVLEHVLYEKHKEPHWHIMCTGSKKAFDIDISSIDTSKITLPDWFNIWDIHVTVTWTFEWNTCSWKLTKSS